MDSSITHNIRQLRIEDAGRVFEISDEVHRRVGASLGAEWTREQIEQECFQFGLVSCDASGVIQSFILYRDMGEAFEISFLATATDASRHGRMRKLFEYFLAVLPANKRVWLEVHFANAPARQMYEALGFRESGKRPSYYPDGAVAVLYNYG